MFNSPSVRDPFSPFWDLRRELDRFFGAPDVDFSAGNGGEFAPSVEVESDDHGLTMYAEIPGVDPEKVSVTVERNVLTITGERAACGPSDATAHRSERRYGKFFRSYQLSDEYDTQKIEASCKNGILTVYVPRRAEAKPRQISVRTA
jgi:HSP20 family protein